MLTNQAIIAALFVTAILSALDISVISTALPTMLRELGPSPAYPWVANSFLLTSTAFAPLFGQTANIFGRRSLILIAVVLFSIGSAVCGAAPTLTALIAGRTVQGIGGAGMHVLSEIIVCDLVPLRHRPKFMGVIFSAFAVTLSIGPVVGGALAEHSSWRWIFYMNLPIGFVAFVLLFVFLRVRHRQDSAGNMFRRIDYAGNALLVAATVAILLALTWGGTKEPWDAWRTLVPLILGLLGLCGFLALEASPLIPEPTMPIRLFSNRTSLSTFVLTFLHSILTFSISYYLPVYFQSALETTPTESGVNALPSAFFSMPFAILAGLGVSKLNRYRPFHFLGFALLAAGYGMFSLLDGATSTAYWVGAQMVAASGVGVLFTTTLPAIQAPLDEEDQAAATATWSFVRAFGGIWGVAIPSAVFNSRVNELLVRLDGDNPLRELMKDGGAFALASREFMQRLNVVPDVKSVVLSIYVDSLKWCWLIGLAFAGAGFLVSFVVKEVPMREHLETSFGLASESESSREEMPTRTESAPMQGNSQEDKAVAV